MSITDNNYRETVSFATPILNINQQQQMATRARTNQLNHLQR